MKQRLADLYGTTVPNIMGRDETGIVAIPTPYRLILPERHGQRDY